MTFGPWVPNIDSGERLARIRSMRALALVFVRPQRDFLEALARAEIDSAALVTALELLEKLPALPKRKLLATYADLSRAR
jgi:hypothetical protein